MLPVLPAHERLHWHEVAMQSPTFSKKPCMPLPMCQPYFTQHKHRQNCSRSSLPEVFFKPKTTPLCPCVFGLGMPKHYTLLKPNMLSRRSPVLIRGCVNAEGSSYMKLFLNSSVDPCQMHHPHASHGVLLTGLTCTKPPRSHLLNLDASLHDALA